MLGSLPACRGSSANAARREARTLRRSPRRFRRSVVVGYARIGGKSDKADTPTHVGVSALSSQAAESAIACRLHVAYATRNQVTG